eukprot:TRINITY_DN178_c0_g1_i2.p1 TRINITY_DN178_c0_g1~~TRINITY_DN178_c0_g1_i2.p1  ORF type:complete len:190 (-),score=48.96 TRINITY_DN178_c0_g1_i2:48-617(-)
MGFEKKIVIDCRGHLLGRLASVVAKQLLEGQKIVAVRCEGLNISGKFIRNKYKFLIYLRKKTATNPKKGPFHFRAPAMIFWKTVRGMLPHRIDRGARALRRLKVFDGIPPPYDTVKKMVVPSALRVLRLKPQRPYTDLGRLATEVGWKYANTVSALEAKRKVKAAAWYERQKKLASFKAQAVAQTQTSA